MAQARARHETFDLRLPPLESTYAVQSTLTQLTGARCHRHDRPQTRRPYHSLLIVASRNLLKADKRTNASRGLPIASRLATSSRLLLLCGPSHWDMWWCSGPSRTSGACLTIGSELETAREIQLSILPSEVPSVSNLRIAAACHARSAVAGDFYQFIPVDPHRLGVLVADVSGHGVPAALISSMLKVAMQSVAANADDPSQVL